MLINNRVDYSGRLQPHMPSLAAQRQLVNHEELLATTDKVQIGATALASIAAGFGGGELLKHLGEGALPMVGLVGCGLAGGALGLAVARESQLDRTLTLSTTAVGLVMGVIAGAVASNNGAGMIAGYVASAVLGGALVFLGTEAAECKLGARAVARLDGPSYALWAAQKPDEYDYLAEETLLVADNLERFVGALQKHTPGLDSEAATRFENWARQYLKAHGSSSDNVEVLVTKVGSSVDANGLDSQSTGLLMGSLIAALADSDRRNYSAYASIGGDFLSAIPGFSQAKVLVAGAKASLKVLGRRQVGEDRTETAGMLKSEVQLAWGEALRRDELDGENFALLRNGMEAGLSANGIL